MRASERARVDECLRATRVSPLRCDTYERTAWTGWGKMWTPDLGTQYAVSMVRPTQGTCSFGIAASQKCLNRAPFFAEAVYSTVHCALLMP
eukprot:SAG11_NODE_1851_length_4167_cov_1.585054_5_plen_91_part_00